MANEVLIYSPIFDFTAESFINQMNDFQGEDVTLRINSPGGSVFAGWGMIAKTQEHTGKVTVKVDGNASSMAAIFLLFHENVEALNVSKFTLHRASIFNPSQQDQKRLDAINKDIRSAFEAKIDVAAFEMISGVMIDDFFNSEDVIDVDINAQQAKQIGLINQINELEPNAYLELTNSIAAISAKQIEASKKVNNSKTNITMTISELKDKHPSVYAEVLALGHQNGVTAEKDRAGAWLAFGDVDFEAVKKGINGGENLSNTVMAELSRKSFSAQTISSMETENEETQETEQESTEEPTAMDEFEKALNNLKK